MANNEFFNRLHAIGNVYQKDLTCHFGCVNAIEFSITGELLVSGGDDRRVMLWQVDKALLDQGNPVKMKATHRAAITTLAITHNQRRIFSGGNDNLVIVHNLETRLPVAVFEHSQAVYSLSVDPGNSNLVVSAGNDGKLLLFDTRHAPSGKHGSLLLAQSRRPFQDVKFHPWLRWAVAASNARHGAAMWDLRRPKKSILRYVDTTGSSMSDSMSVRFNSNGTHIVALRRRQYPILYNSRRPYPVAELYHEDYFNTCTMKSCSFAGTEDQYVLSGSDDFNIYAWNVSEIGAEVVDPGMYAILSPEVVLSGHRSIVNHVGFNTINNLIVSSGVEKTIKLWSTAGFPEKQDALLEEGQGSDNPREISTPDEQLPFELEQLTSHNDVRLSTSEDQYMIAFYDTLVQQELDYRAEENALLEWFREPHSGCIKVEQDISDEGGVYQIIHEFPLQPRFLNTVDPHDQLDVVAPSNPKTKRGSNKNRLNKRSRSSNLGKTRSKIVTRSISKGKRTPARRTRGPRIDPPEVGQSHSLAGQIHLRLGRSHSMILRTSRISAPSSERTDSDDAEPLSGNRLGRSHSMVLRNSRLSAPSSERTDSDDAQLLSRNRLGQSHSMVLRHSRLSAPSSERKDSDDAQPLSRNRLGQSHSMVLKHSRLMAPSSERKDSDDAQPLSRNRLRQSHSMVLRHSRLMAPSSERKDSDDAQPLSRNSGRIGPLTRSANKKKTEVISNRKTRNLRSNGNGVAQDSNDNNFDNNIADNACNQVLAEDAEVSSRRSGFRRCRRPTSDQPASIPSKL